MLKVSDVAVLPEKKFWIGKVTAKQCTTMEFRKGYNQAIDEISQLPVKEIDRERLAKIIFNTDIFNTDKGKGPDSVLYESYKYHYFDLADAIISSLPELFGVKK